MAENANVTISFVGPGDMKAWLDKQAQDNDRSLSSLLRLIIVDYWDRNGVGPESAKVDDRQLALPVGQ